MRNSTCWSQISKYRVFQKCCPENNSHFIELMDIKQNLIKGERERSEEEATINFIPFLFANSLFFFLPLSSFLQMKIKMKIFERKKGRNEGRKEKEKKIFQGIFQLEEPRGAEKGNAKRRKGETKPKRRLSRS